eukprot:766141-Pyramimonas_sp.AAC.1
MGGCRRQTAKRVCPGPVCPAGGPPVAQGGEMSGAAPPRRARRKKRPVHVSSAGCLAMLRCG